MGVMMMEIFFVVLLVLVLVGEFLVVLVFGGDGDGFDVCLVLFLVLLFLVVVLENKGVGVLLGWGDNVLVVLRVLGMEDLVFNVGNFVVEIFLFLFEVCGFFLLVIGLGGFC